LALQLDLISAVVFVEELLLSWGKGREELSGCWLLRRGLKVFYSILQ